MAQVGSVTIEALFDDTFAKGVNNHVFFYPPAVTFTIGKGKCVADVAAFDARPAVYVSGHISPEVRPMCGVSCLGCCVCVHMAARTVRLRWEGNMHCPSHCQLLA